VGRRRSEGRITDPRDMRMKETGIRQRRIRCLLRDARMQKGLQGHTWIDGLLFGHLNGKTDLSELRIFKSTISGSMGVKLGR
jgi:hypothetical protein